ncbi:MAG: CPBP family intramembrane metalloprotease [Coriobacteriia bacterium]|nr:CPBP family intramembrane metalloprotease [Coriobacteriia bacterium]
MRQGPPLSLDARACDRCGACLAVCPHDALKVGRTYLKVDWARCDGCGACARVCPRRAIVSRAATSSLGTRTRTQPVARKRSSGVAVVGPTPRTRSAAAKAASMTPKRAPRGGSRGGFQWTLLEAAAMLSVTFSVFMMKEAISVSEWVTALDAQAQLLVRVLVLALYYAAQVGVIVWLVHRRGGDPALALGIRHESHPWQEVLGSAGSVIVGLVVTRALASVYALVTREMGLLPHSVTDLPSVFGGGGAGFMLAVLMVVLIGPTVEELVFRGALQEGLAARFGVWPAIVVQAALFAAFHRSWWLLVPTFILGVVLGYLAERRDSLWPPIALHALYNAITVVAAFLVSAPSA